MSSIKKQSTGVNKNITRKKRIKQIGESCQAPDEQCKRGSRCKDTKEYGKICIEKDELPTNKGLLIDNSDKGVEKEPVMETEKEPSMETEKEPSMETEKEPSMETEKEPAMETEKEPGHSSHSNNHTVEQIALLNEYEIKNDVDKEKMAYTQFANITHDMKEYEFLYPELNDSDMQVKIAQRQEFADTKYDGEIGDVEQRSNDMCNSEFTLMPHQMFVRNFLSQQTPYNSLLLYHGLGSGKTCSAIGIAEEARMYYKQLTSFSKKTLFNGKICVVASPSVQKNFRLQLFDERKLKQVDGQWSLHTCIGQSILSEINPMSMKNQSYETIVSTIQSIINDSYVFIGYRELTNKLHKIVYSNSVSNQSDAQKEKRIQKYVDNSLLIIDECHNIRNTDDRKDKILVDMLLQISYYCNNFRLLLLSATPIYNNPREIVWITNLLNAVDKRSKIHAKTIFDKQDNLMEPAPGLFNQPSNEDIGSLLLRRKLNGYVSYVRGENPYTFPYRVYPSEFINMNQDISVLETVVKENYIDIIKNTPEFQMNTDVPLPSTIQHMDLYTHSMGKYQETVYKYIMEYMKQNMDKGNDYSKFDNMETFGYTFLQKPLEALNIVYPVDGIEEDMEAQKYSSGKIKDLIGVSGLKRVVSHKLDKYSKSAHEYEYKNTERIFHQDNIHKYSHKIAKITKLIKEGAEGIIMVYSHYLSAGIIPMALALEEMGFARYSSSNQPSTLFSKDVVTTKIDSLTMKSQSEYDSKHRPFQQARYVMITGEKELSANNINDLKYITHPDNSNGSKVKVVLITRAAAEGLDFKNIRQIHLMEPWYNTNRMEQIIGRGVRNNSHCDLELNQRNVEIYFHSTSPVEKRETVDLYIYRYAELKAIKIGRVTRVLKEVATDCLLNHSQTNFSEDKMNKDIQLLSSTMSSSIPYKVGDKSYSSTCDYMESCDFKCTMKDKYDDNITYQYTNSSEFAKNSILPITKRLRELFKENIFYNYDTLVEIINVNNKYNEEHIFFTIDRFTSNKHDYVTDQYNRKGYLVRNDNFILFQPLEITDEYISLYHRTVPILYKEKYANIRIPTKIDQIQQSTTNVLTNMVEYSNEISEAEDIISDMINTIRDESLNKKSWYYRAEAVKGLFIEELGTLSEKEWTQYKIDHYLDLLDWNTQKKIFNHILQNEHEYKDYIVSYLDAQLLSGFENIYLFFNNRLQLYEKSSNNTLIPIDDAFLRKYSEQLRNHIFEPRQLSRIYGFFYEKNGAIEFKLRQSITTGNYLGRMCNNFTISDIYNHLNTITMKKDKYNDNYLKEWSKTHITNKIQSSVFVTNASMCTLIELLLRAYNKTHKDSKKWLLSLAERNLNEHLFVAPKKGKQRK